MRIFIRTILLIMLFSFCNVKIYAEENLYILNDKCINELVDLADKYFKFTDIDVIRDTRGIDLRFEITEPMSEYFNITPETYKKILQIAKFLTKIENSAIIEVHTAKRSNQAAIKNWEVSTVIANNLMDIVLQLSYNNLVLRLNSVGYGEFLPAKNTSNNGGNYLNRVDIIILCNVSGE